MIQIHTSKCFLLFYQRKSRERSKTLTEEDAIKFSTTMFYGYCESDDYAFHNAAYGKSPSPSTGNKEGYTDIGTSLDALMVPEVFHGVNYNKSYEEDLKGDKCLILETVFIYTALMHHMHFVWKDTYDPTYMLMLLSSKKHFCMLHQKPI
jgi:hypothetical protein